MKSRLLNPGAMLALARTMCGGIAHAGVVYDETLDGDLANAMESAPWISPGTDLGVFTAGAHTVRGTFGRPPGSVLDSDVITWRIASGMKLDALLLNYAILEGDNGNGSYFSIAAGPTVGSGMTSAAGNLSDALVPASTDLLAAWSAGPYVFGTGPTVPLPAGTYTLMAHETSPRRRTN